MAEQDHKQQGGWLPGQEDLEAWLQGHAERTAATDTEDTWHPAVQRFHRLVASDPALRMYAKQMIEQVPPSKPYRQRHLHSFEQMLSLVEAVLTTSPEFSEGSMVTTPMWTGLRKLKYPFQLPGRSPCESRATGMESIEYGMGT